MGESETVRVMAAEFLALLFLVAGCWCAMVLAWAALP